MDVVAAMAALLGLLMAGLFVILWATRWRQAQPEQHDPHDQIKAYRELLDTGEISSEEYARICQELANRADSLPPKDKAE